MLKNISFCFVVTLIISCCHTTKLLKIEKSNGNYGVKIIIPGKRIEDLIFSEVKTSDDFRQITIIPKNSFQKNNVNASYAAETPVVMRDMSNDLLYFTNVLSDPPKTEITNEMLEKEGNCFYIKNFKTGLFFTYNREVFSESDNALLRPFNRLKEQVLCMSKNSKTGLINICFKSDNNICLKGVKEKETRANSYLLKYSKKDDLDLSASSYEFESDYTSDVTSVIPNIKFMKLKIGANSLPIAFFNEIAKAYKPIEKLMNRSAGYLKNPYSRWEIFLER